MLRKLLSSWSSMKEYSDSDMLKPAHPCFRFAHPISALPETVRSKDLRSVECSSLLRTAWVSLSFREAQLEPMCSGTNSETRSAVQLPSGASPANFSGSVWLEHCLSIS